MPQRDTAAGAAQARAGPVAKYSVGPSARERTPAWEEVQVLADP